MPQLSQVYCFHMQVGQHSVGLVITAVLAFLLHASLTAEAPAFSLSQAYGPHGIGFRVVDQYDHARSFAHHIGPLGAVTTEQRDRPLQTLIWYPGTVKDETKVTFSRYRELADDQYTFTPVQKGQTPAAQRGLHQGQSDVMHAVENAAPEPRKFPLVIYAPAFTSPSFENADLCEYLASFGFVVIASPSNGAHGPMTGDGLEGVHAQAQDISFLIGFAESLKQVDASRVAVIGYSWGGLSNFFAAANDDRITALVCLDGSARYFPKKIEDSKEVYPHRLTLPILFFTSMNQSLEELIEDQQDVSASVLNDLIHSDLWIVNMQQMTHENFSAASDRTSSATVGQPIPDFTDQEIATSYGWMARYTLEFLLDELKDSAPSKKFLQATPREDGVPTHLLSLTFRAGTGIPMTVQALALKAHEEGFIKLPVIYADAKKANNDDLSNSDLISWGEELIGQGHLNEGIEVMKLTISLHPDVWYPYRVLSQAYVANHQPDLALAMVKELLQRDPQNEFGKTYLKTLEAGSSR